MRYLYNFIGDPYSHCSVRNQMDRQLSDRFSSTIIPTTENFDHSPPSPVYYSVYAAVNVEI